MSDLYFLTVNYYSTSLIARLLDSLATNTVIDYQFIIVNNSPDDHELPKIKRNSVIIIESSKNLGFGEACNLGLDFIARQNGQAIVWLINPDAYFVAENSDTAIAFFRQHSHISILGTTVYKSSGEVDFAGGTFIPGKGTISTINLLPTDLKTDYVKSDWISAVSYTHLTLPTTYC
jgi:N-acetylglucosaminyl-diphospho-decaprenol L-rhamnosyltransferase